ncbi:hypothetical protein RJ641_026222 [Dillenia turbinata]|uniref:Histone acetyltransferase n=1 Tax=Dillenia turbinata TaxID=194707 RepID=A0AAN8ZTX3_9MAGN
MPRPGPRPYECVRRAWHSDRHQPMRGSIIQQIFRLVNETHSSATRRNREWQEKLPIVVLKVEEIMYSKANSEAEYMDLDTLWDRVNDSIDTIIRREESIETGDLLRPCIEVVVAEMICGLFTCSLFYSASYLICLVLLAALNLGCVPIRASRSQRLSNPRNYLTPRPQQPPSIPSRVPDVASSEQNSHLNFMQQGNQSSTSKPAVANLTNVVSHPNNHALQNEEATAPISFPVPYGKFPIQVNNSSMTVQTNSSLNLGSVYPLYYGTCYGNVKSKAPLTLTSDPILVGKPVVASSVPENTTTSVLQNFFPNDCSAKASDRFVQSDSVETCEMAPEAKCDLTLRLGLLPGHGLNMERRLAQETEMLGSSSSGSKLGPQAKVEFSFFPTISTNDTFESCLFDLNSEGESSIMEASIRKRKAPVSNVFEDGQFCLDLEPSSYQRSQKNKIPELERLGINQEWELKSTQKNTVVSSQIMGDEQKESSASDLDELQRFLLDQSVE